MPVTRTELVDFLRFAPQASGSVGPFTVSRNAHGSFIRDRVNPLQPNNLLQQQRKLQFGVLAQRWRDTLTDPQRHGWRRYAAAVPLVDRIGRRTFITAQQHYMRSNIIRMTAPTSLKDTPPTVHRLVAYSQVFLKITAAFPPMITISWNVNDEFANEAGALVYVFASAQHAPSVLTFIPPLIYKGFRAAIATPPVTVRLRGAATVGHRVWTKILIQRYDARLSTPQIRPVTIT